MIINAGKNYGISIGDTFGVRLKNSVLTDPDTGLPLTKEGDPIGIIRVVKVEDKLSYARILESVEQLKRGDELIWIGMYQSPEIVNARWANPPNIQKKSEASSDSVESNRTVENTNEIPTNEKKSPIEKIEKTPSLKSAEKDVNIDTDDGKVPEIRKFPNKNNFQECSLFNDMIMTRIPAGSFMLGSSSGISIDPDEGPAHKVVLNEYWISKFEVTFEQYDHFCDDTGRSKPKDQGWGRGKHPVINVTWEDARQYCLWLSKKSGLIFSLPTEAEWERAAANFYPWGANKPNNQLCNFNKEVGMTKPVGSYPQGASPFGIYDLAGNVWEWVADYYGSDYYKKSGISDPRGPASGSKRVIRGGAWDSNFNSVRSSERNSNDPDTMDFRIGFRVSMREKQ